MKKTQWVAIGSLIITIIITSVYSQKRGFPQQIIFPNCIKPSISQLSMNMTISEYYQYWKGEYLTNAGSTTGGYYVRAEGTGDNGNALTVSEAHGYGMIIMALMAGEDDLAEPDAKQFFDGMFYFFSDHLSETGPNLMSWQVFPSGNGESFEKDGSATDGDLDIAYALILAHYQWGSDGSIDYLSEAKKVINDIKDYETDYNSKRIMLGDWTEIDNPNYRYLVSRPSDWMTGHFRSFSEETGSDFWDEVADTVYSLTKQFTSIHSPTTGLVSEFVDGFPPQPYNFNGKLYYSYNACRFPWRIATDYAHYGTPEAKETCNKIIDWLIDETNSTPRDIVNGYNLDGTAAPDVSGESAAFTAPFMAACIVDKSATNKDYRTFLNKGWNAIITEENDYFEDTINLLCMLLISGNWWKPEEAIIKISDKMANCDYIRNLRIRCNSASKIINISYSLAKRSNVRINIFNLKGKMVKKLAKGIQNRGNYSVAVNFSKNTLTSGVYFVRLWVDGIVFNTQLSFVK